MGRMKKLLFILLSVIVIGALLVGIAFYTLVISGAFPTIQSLWVSTAMTTLSHQYLATWFIPDEKIAEIMEANYVDDSAYESEVFTFKEEAPPIFDILHTYFFDTTRDIGTKRADPYLAEGYTLLEEGLYLKEVSGTGWQGYLMLIEDPLRVKLVDTARQFTCGQKVMTMINNVGGVAGINGGGFTDGENYDSNGGMPSGMVIEDGRIVYPTSSEAISSQTYSMVGINRDGVLVLRHCTAGWAIKNDIVSAVTFMPFIIVNGEGTIKKGTGGWGIAPRTAIGQRETGEILFLVIDGRQLHSIGVDLLPLQETLLAENCINAAMMDGGSSTVMIYNGEFVNKPSLGFERYINNCWVVMPKETEEP